MPTADHGLASTVAAAASLSRRFYALRHLLADARSIPAEQLRAVLDVFPDGWARRRALLEMVRSGVPAGVRDALVLVESLGLERDRFWCLSALADQHLEARDREALLAAVPSPKARRRLEVRLGRE
jgi:hypothetical protein